MWQGFLQITLTLVIVIALTPILGNYMASVFLGKPTFLDGLLKPVESRLYSFFQLRIMEATNTTGSQYIKDVLLSNLMMGIFVFGIFMTQNLLPLNPTKLDAPTWHLALHTTISFLTNTDQQHYSGETTYSYASQVFALGFLMFTSAGTGLALGIAFIRGLTGKRLGNFYVDLTQSITRILLPISIVGAIILLLGGIPETLSPPVTVTTLEGANQVIAVSPVAHFEIIKQLGENGGGFFGINSAHPYENPNAFSNLVAIIAMISIPTSLIYAYGIFANNKRQAWLIFWMVFVIFAVLIGVSAMGEYQGNPLVNNILGEQQSNLEGKEIRFGWAQTALWAIVTTGTMCGAVNGMHDSLMPEGGFSTLFNLFLQIIWGGQGTGTAYLFVYLILTVFVTGLMVGRTPEFLGRKIEKPEIILASTPNWK
jgi:K+-transporting ATPase ATPase A chain